MRVVDKVIAAIVFLYFLFLFHSLVSFNFPLPLSFNDQWKDRVQENIDKIWEDEKKKRLSPILLNIAFRVFDFVFYLCIFSHGQIKQSQTKSKKRRDQKVRTTN